MVCLPDLHLFLWGCVMDKVYPALTGKDVNYPRSYIQNQTDSYCPRAECLINPLQGDVVHTPSVYHNYNHLRNNRVKTGFSSSKSMVLKLCLLVFQSNPYPSGLVWRYSYITQYIEAMRQSQQTSYLPQWYTLRESKVMMVGSNNVSQSYSCI